MRRIAILGKRRSRRTIFLGNSQETDAPTRTTSDELGGCGARSVSCFDLKRIFLGHTDTLVPQSQPSESVDQVFTLISWGYGAKRVSLCSRRPPGGPRAEPSITNKTLRGAPLLGRGASVQIKACGRIPFTYKSPCLSDQHPLSALVCLDARDVFMPVAVSFKCKTHFALPGNSVVYGELGGLCAALERTCAHIKPPKFSIPQASALQRA